MPKICYVYMYLDPEESGLWKYKEFELHNRPFYVGIGISHRKTVHLTPSRLKEKSIKNNILKRILSIGNKPIILKLFEDISREEANKIEIDIIKHFGRIKTKDGILANITPGGEGHVGLVHSEEFLNTLRKPVYQYDLEGNFVKEWASMKEAEEYYSCNITQAIYKEGTSKGFQWRFEKVDKLEPKIPGTPSVSKRYKYVMKKDGVEIKTFNSFSEIQEYFEGKASFGNLSSACRGILKCHLGYQWERYR